MNIFVESLSPESKQMMENIRKNKAFATKIANDIAEFYHCVLVTKDIKDGCSIRICKSTNIRFYNEEITADETSVYFHAKVSGYRQVKRTPNNSYIFEVGPIYERYKETSRADSNFLGSSNMGDVTFNIPIPFDLKKYEVINDISAILERSLGYIRRF